MTERITRAPLITPPIDRPPFNAAEYRPAQPLQVPQAPASLGDWLRGGWMVVRLSPYFISLAWGILMKNWKTTIGAIVGAIGYILNATGVINLTADVQMAIVTIALFVIGLFAGDASASNGSEG